MQHHTNHANTRSGAERRTRRALRGLRNDAEHSSRATARQLRAQLAEDALAGAPAADLRDLLAQLEEHDVPPHERVSVPGA